MEEWKQVPSLPEWEASSEGRVRRVPFEQSMTFGGTHLYVGKPRRGSWDVKTQRRLIVFRRKTFKVHRLVCEAFHGPPPPGRNICLHLDEDPDNNRPDNLRWGTQKENLSAPLLRQNLSETAVRRRRGLSVADHPRSFQQRQERRAPN